MSRRRRRLRRRGLTHDEAAVLAALACARWSAVDTARCLAGFLDPDSAAAAARAAVRVREPRAAAMRPGVDGSFTDAESERKRPAVSGWRWFLTEQASSQALVSP